MSSKKAPQTLKYMVISTHIVGSDDIQRESADRDGRF
jgi:hypothetical protein